MHMQARVDAYETRPMITQAWPYCGIASQMQERLAIERSLVVSDIGLSRNPAHVASSLVVGLLPVYGFRSFLTRLERTRLRILNLD